MTDSTPLVPPDPDRPVDEEDAWLQDAVDEIGRDVPDEERPVGPPPEGEDPMAGPAPSG